MFKRKRLIVVAVVLLFAAAAAVNLLRAKYVVPIIMYHSVSAEACGANRLNVSAQTFERQMRFLSSHHYNVVTVEALAKLLKNKKSLPPKTIAITFDDGYANNYTYAFPVLKKYRLPATIFIIVNEVGRAQGDRLNWDQIRRLRDSGLISIGSHTLGPEPLINIKSEDALRAQIFDSKRRLEEELSIPVTVFSYPGGFFDPKIRQMVVDAGYTAAVATNPGKDYPGGDIFALKRLRISENARSMFVFAVETSGYYTFMKESKRKKRYEK